MRYSETVLSPSLRMRDLRLERRVALDHGGRRRRLLEGLRSRRARARRGLREGAGGERRGRGWRGAGAWRHAESSQFSTFTRSERELRLAFGGRGLEAARVVVVEDRVDHRLRVVDHLQQLEVVRRRSCPSAARRLADPVRQAAPERRVHEDQRHPADLAGLHERQHLEAARRACRSRRAASRRRDESFTNMTLRAKKCWKVCESPGRGWRAARAAAGC